VSDEAEKPFIIPVFIPHSGCPHRCAFCNQETITGKNRLIPSPENLRTDVGEYLRYKGARRTISQVAFYGGNFLGLDPEKIRILLGAVQPFVKTGKIDSIRFSTRPDTITENRLDLLKPFPVQTIELGVQSMDDRVLDRVHRGHCAADTERAVYRLKAARYEVGLQVMVGLPGEDPESCLLTGEKTAALLPDFVRIYPTVILKNSLLAKWYHGKTYTPLTLDQAVLRSKHLYRIFSGKNIRVIRMGLQPTTDMAVGTDILAGPHHPAFGELVYSALFYDNAAKAIAAMDHLPEEIELKVHPKNVSKMRGVRNENLKKLSRQFGLDSIRVYSDPSLQGHAVTVQ
jgi:histone acetyltransferase (RNA polymerase elongator complex component)